MHANQYEQLLAALAEPAAEGKQNEMEPSIPSAELPAFPRLLFGRHQGYDLREQWITRGLLALAGAEHLTARARLFVFPDATDRFGIGPGMVAALRYWLRATGLMVEQTASKAGRHVPALTPLGSLLAQHDPYLQHSGSLWLLHAHLARSLLLAPTFYWFFQCFVGTTPFTKEECLQALLSWAIKDAPSQRIAPEVLRKDLECLLRIYTHQPQHTTPEQAVLASPFRRLRLLQYALTGPSVSGVGAPTRRGGMRYVLCPPQAGEIPPLVVLALILEQNQAVPRVPLTHLLYRQTHIGRTCCLKQGTLLHALQRLQEGVPDWCPRSSRVDEQEWMILPSVPAERVLLQYYQQP
jgi:hypothetical protein